MSKIITIDMINKRELRITEKMFSLENDVITLALNAPGYDLTGKIITAVFNPSKVETGALEVVDGVIQIPIYSSMVQYGINYIQLNFRWKNKLEQSGRLMWVIGKSLETEGAAQENVDIINYLINEINAAKQTADRVVSDVGDIKTALDGSIEDAEESKVALEGSISTAGTTKIALDGSIEDAGTAKSEIEQAIINNQTVTQSQLADIAINVRLYGAKGDGTDDSISIQNALEHAPNGSSLVFPYTEQGYGISSGLDLLGKSNLTIKGLGGIVKIKHLTNSNTATFKASNTTNLTFENFEIDVNAAEQDANLYPAFVNNSFYLADIIGVTLKNIFVKNSIRDLKMLRCSDIIVENVHVDGAMVDGWSIDNCSNGVFRNISAKNVTNDGLAGDVNGFEVEDGSRDLSFYDVVTDGCGIGSGFRIKSHDGVTICERININNLRSYNCYTGFSVTNNCKDIIVNNFKSSSNSGGVKLENVENIMINNVDITSGGTSINIVGVKNLYIADGQIFSGKVAIRVGAFDTGNINFRGLSVLSNDQSIYTQGIGGSANFESCVIESIKNSTVWIIGQSKKTLFRSCSIIIPEGSRRIILDNTSNVTFDNCEITSLSTSVFSIRYSVENFTIINSIIKGITNGICIAHETPSSFIRGDNIKIDGNLFIDTGRHMNLVSSDVAPIKNLSINNNTFKGGTPVFWSNSRGADNITFIGNILDDVTWLWGSDILNNVVANNIPEITE